MENEIVAPFKPKFYRRYSDDLFIIHRRKKNIEDIFFNRFNNYRKNIKVIIEINPTKFLGK